MTLGEQGPLQVGGAVRHAAGVPWPVLESLSLVGAPGRTRTCDLEIRKLLLYPAELRGHVPAAGAGNARIVGERPSVRCRVSRVGNIGHGRENHVSGPGLSSGQWTRQACGL